MADSLSPLFGWRGKIASSDLEPTSRHVALTLSLWMNEMGGSAFPSVETLERATGLSRRTVQSHLSLLVVKGWLKRTARKNDEGRQGSHLYESKVPRGAAVAPLIESRGADDDIPGVQLTAFRGAAVAPEVVIKTSIEDVNALFDHFYAVFPLKKAKPKAREAFVKALKVASAEEIIAGAQRYRDDPTRKPDFTAYPATWLNAGRWEDEVAPPNGTTPPLRRW